MSILNLATLQNIENLAAQTVSQAILRPTGLGDSSIGVSGFLFDVIGMEEMLSEADITDHFVEDNTAIQDQMALRPRRFILQGFSGELNNDLDAALSQLFSAVSGIPVLDSLLPGFTTGANQTYAAIEAALAQANEAVSQAKSIYGVFATFATMATKQQLAYNAMLSMQQSRQFCSVETPFGTFQNMLIESISAKQDETTQMVTEFRICLKEVRVISTVVATNLESSLGRVANAVSETANNGQAPGNTVPSNTVTLKFAPGSLT